MLDQMHDGPKQRGFDIFTFAVQSLSRIQFHILFVTMICSQAGFTQDLSNERIKAIPISADTVILDSLSIIPGSLTIKMRGKEVPMSAFELDPFRAAFIWKDPITPDTLIARYRTMPLSFTQVRRHKDPEQLIARASDRSDPFKYRPGETDQDLFGLQELNKSGSISRGVLFGNNQDLSVNSTLNLELQGRLSDNVQVVASVTDNNIPIQASGNTLELQDFDQVFIKLFNEDEWELIAGDFVLQRPNSYFLTYLKKAKGLTFSNQNALGEKGDMRSRAGAAISKGKFARNQIQGIEGEQGPYRLRGDDNAAFIIVLSGTERIYIDGEQLLRGQENDYVIDYNTAELTFTAKRLITKDKRIVAEFQYSDRNYTRSLAHVGNRTEIGKTTFDLNVYTEQDHKNQPFQQELNESEKQVLSEAGDDPLLAVVMGVTPVPFDPSLVLYISTDSLGYSPVYIYSATADSNMFQLTFTDVGVGNGDYILDDLTANGRVFKWVVPDTVNNEIIRKGNYMPVRQLVAPNSQQVITLGIAHKASEHTTISSEFGFSNNDLNTFSSRNSGDDQGLAAHIRVDHAILLDTTRNGWQLLTLGEIETVGRNFKAVERYRPVEFERNWNARQIPIDGDQAIITGGIGIRRRSQQVLYTLGTFQVKDLYAGVKHDLSVDLRPERTEIKATGSLLQTTLPTRSELFRHRATLARKFKPITFGFKDEHELNRYSSTIRDSLAVTSYQFYDWEVFVQSPDTFVNKFRLSAGQRYDQAVREGRLEPATVATNYNARFEIGKDARNRLRTTLTYRRLQIVDSGLTTQPPENTYLTRLEYDLSAWKGAATFNLFYEFGAGLEQKREFIYVEVPAGQGVYIWVDYNNNDVRELNEFEVASFGYEADFIRVFVPSTEFVSTYSNQFSASVDLRPQVVWLDKTGVRKALAKFSDQAAYRIDRKTGTDDLGNAIVPFILDPLDSALISLTSSFRNSLFFDRTSRTWSVDHTHQDDRSKSFLLIGSESRTRIADKVGLRWNLTRRWSVNIDMEVSNVIVRSELFTDRNFSVEERKGAPKLTWQPNTTLRAALSIAYSEKDNAAEFGGQRYIGRDLSAELRYSAAGKGSIQLNASYIKIEYDGIVSSPLGNEMLRGLRPGPNVTWSATIQRNLSKNLQMDLTYNGRRSDGSKAVHVGGAQVRAFF